MREAFLDAGSAVGQARIRSYVLGWLERLDYSDRLERCWPAAELAGAIWERVERDFAHHWVGPVVSNAPLARVIAETAVDDYLAAYPAARDCRYAVGCPLGDASFRRCVLDFLHDLEEFGPEELSADADEAALAFWREVRESPHRWEYSPQRGPFVDDEVRARRVVRETIEEWHELRERARELGSV